ncbi:D-alanyl-D-alanine carboxypeptidase [Candidatus Gottesmanbacteria bacterium]|nr:D-alanyl-D-alanine carboxypeptidase [Candidatus Gottesmanbacteria bacterium]
MAKRKVVYRRENLWSSAWDKILILVLLAVFVLLSPGQNVYTTATVAKPSLFRLSFPIPSPAPYPVNVGGFYPGSEITASAIVIVDVDSSVVMFERNANLLLSPASTTKIMTALVALDTYDLDEVLTVKNLLTDGQSMKLVVGEKLTVENLLYGTLVASGNDAAFVLADNYPGGVDAFVVAMNEKAKKLKLTKTHFTNPMGFDDAGHKMSAMDLANLARVALANPTVSKMVAIPQITISDVSHTYYHPLTNINELLGKIPGVGGIKTGWTEEAGENLVTLVERNGHNVILVVLHSDDRFAETTALIDWIFGNFRWEDLKPAR